jgi:hypothetical protein
MTLGRAGHSELHDDSICLARAVMQEGVPRYGEGCTSWQLRDPALCHVESAANGVRGLGTWNHLLDAWRLTADDEERQERLTAASVGQTQEERGPHDVARRLRDVW